MPLWNAAFLRLNPLRGGTLSKSVLSHRRSNSDNTTELSISFYLNATRAKSFSNVAGKYLSGVSRLETIAQVQQP